MLTNNTPVEEHRLNGRPVLVKREDLCCPLPGPSFSKMRGVVAHIQNRPEGTIGVLDTFHSKAGWAVSWACHELGKQAVNFWPRYKADGPAHLPRVQQQRAEALGARMLDLPAGRSAVLYHAARKKLREADPDAYLMPNALKLPESITENAAEARRTCEAGAIPDRGNLILSVSSGTVAAGVLKGLAEAGFLDNYWVMLHLGYSRSIDTMRAYMEKVSGLDLSDKGHFHFVDEGYGYADAAKGPPAPFPCNPYYDRKAWSYLAKGGDGWIGDRPVVFWNIGD